MSRLVRVVTSEGSGGKLERRMAAVERAPVVVAASALSASRNSSPVLAATHRGAMGWRRPLARQLQCWQWCVLTLPPASLSGPELSSLIKSSHSAP
jgi:hypothetical protein